MADPDATAGAPTLSLRKKILFSGVLLVAMFALLEGASIWYLKATDGYDGTHFLHYDFDPYKNIALSPGYRDTRGVTHNGQGFRRTTDVALEKPDDTYRIFLMGGSTAYGTGGLWPHLQTDFEVIADESTISAFIERQLSARFPDRKIEVINAAIPSIWTHHHLIYLNQSILRYQPDMVLFLDGFNDFFFFHEGHDQFAGYAYREHSNVVMGPPTLKSLAYTNAWWFFRKSAFGNVASRALRTLGALVNRPDEEPPLDPNAAFAGLQRVFPRNALQMIERTALILEHEGVEGVFMLQPMLILEGGRSLGPEEQELYDFNVASYMDGWGTFVERAVPWIAETERATVEELGGYFLDLTDVFENVRDEQIFTDYAHLTPRGNEILAREVSRFIEPLISDQRTAQ